MIFIYICMPLIALTFVAITILQIIKIKKCNLYTEGTIIKVKEDHYIDRHGRISHFFTPTFKFNVDGKEYVKEAFFERSPINQYKEGQKIQVAYYQENPMDAIIIADKESKKRVRNYVAKWIILLIILLSFSLLFHARKNKDRDNVQETNLTFSHYKANRKLCKY